MPRKKSPGRPRGRKNRTYEAVVELPAACPKCGGTDLKAVRGAEPLVRQIEGSWEGRDYNRVVWRSKQCATAGCGQFLKVRTYEKENTKCIKRSA